MRNEIIERVNEQITLIKMKSYENLDYDFLLMVLANEQIRRQKEHVDDGREDPTAERY